MSRTIVGGNLELSNRASLEQTGASISERIPESIAESRIAARVDTFAGSEKRETSPETKAEPKVAS